MRKMRRRCDAPPPAGKITSMSDPFHEGERAVQEQTGERDTAIRHGRLIADIIPPGARSFIGEQQYCVLGWTASAGEVWAAFATGPRGFAASAEDGKSLTLNFPVGPASTGDRGSIVDFEAGDPLGLLFIDFATRRRLRVNGQVSDRAGNELRLSVAEAFPNCPKYIQRRELVEKEFHEKKAEFGSGRNWTPEVRECVVSSDTFFVASANPEGNADVSHRGGKPGFVQFRNDALFVPDYPGNSMFGTLGNFAINPHAGLVFVDFENGRQLQMTGSVVLDLEAGEGADAGRSWRFHMKEWVITPLAHSFAWRFEEASPYNP